MTFPYLEATLSIAKQEFGHLGTIDLRVMLLMTNTNAVTVRDTAKFVSDITTLDEFDGVGYTAGGQVIDITVLQKDAANDRVELIVAPNVWNPLAEGTRQIAGALVYKFVTNNADSLVFGFVDDGGFPKTPGSPFTITWSAEGMTQLTCSLS